MYLTKVQPKDEKFDIQRSVYNAKLKDAIKKKKNLK